MTSDITLPFRYISISGLIGAGKSTLATALSREMNLPLYKESINVDGYLADFYKDRKRYSFPLQVSLLTERFRQQQHLIWGGKGGVQDRTIYEDCIFAKMLFDNGDMEERDYKTYLNLFKHMSNFMARPCLIVHLDVTPEESLERIKMRARGMETAITVEYLQSLHDGYENFLDRISRDIPVLRVSWGDFRTAEEMAEVIIKVYSKMKNIRFVDFEGAAHYRVSSDAIPTRVVKFTKSPSTSPVTTPEKSTPLNLEDSDETPTELPTSTTSPPPQDPASRLFQSTEVTI